LDQPNVMGSKMGILRYIVVGAVAFALLPTPPVSQLQARRGIATPVAKLETHTLLSAAIGTVADVATFCARQPQTCEAMASVASVAEAKAKYSLKLAYEWANGQPAAKQLRGTIDSNGISDLLQQPVAPAQAKPAPAAGLKQSAADPLVTGSTTRVAGNDTGTNTLRIDDLIPDWRGPEPARPS
jgi:hypothetical protein